MVNSITKLLSLITFITLIFTSCYYDNEEDLYPYDPGTSCDTLNITYINTLKPIMEESCVSCHQVSNPSGGVLLDSYEATKEQAENGRLWGSINHDDGYSAMPLGGSKLNDCDLQKIKAWINNDAPQ